MSARRVDSERAAVGSAVLDVSALPTEAFGHRNIAWWATIGFMLIEGTTMALCIASYFYLRTRSFVTWPPPPAPLPSLGVPTLSLLLLLATTVPMWRAARAAKRMDLRPVRGWLVAGTAMTFAVNVLRGFEFRALDVSYRDGVYGSLSWITLGFHTTLLVVNLFETATIAAILHRERIEPKHFVDVDDAAAYQFFLSLTMIPVYLVLYWSPRWF